MIFYLSDPERAALSVAEGSKDKTLDRQVQLNPKRSEIIFETEIFII